MWGNSSISEPGGCGSLAEPTRLLAVSPNLPGNMERQRWCLRDYAVKGTLYVGYAASVYVATCMHSNTDVVLKVYARCSQAPDVAQHEMYREVAIQSSLQHPHVVHLLAAFQDGDGQSQALVLVQEYAGGGDLLALMREHGGRLAERDAVGLVVRPLLEALHYLHRWGIVHRDVKPENVLFCNQQPSSAGDVGHPHHGDGGGACTLKLADFGLAINLVEERPISRVGTLDYMAPEVVSCPVKLAMAPPTVAPRYSAHVDVWALGVMTYEMLTGLPPFASDTRQEVELRIHAASYSFPASMSAAASDFIARALAPHPGDRPTIRDMLTHPWITGAQVPISSSMLPASCSYPCYSHRAQPGGRPHHHTRQPQEHPALPAQAAMGYPQPQMAQHQQHRHTVGGQAQHPHAIAAGAAAAGSSMLPAHHHHHHPNHHQHLVPTVAPPSLHQQQLAQQQQQQTAGSSMGVHFQGLPGDGGGSAELARLVDVSKLSLEQMQSMAAALQRAIDSAAAAQQQQQHASATPQSSFTPFGVVSASSSPPPPPGSACRNARAATADTCMTEAGGSGGGAAATTTASESDAATTCSLGGSGSCRSTLEAASSHSQRHLEYACRAAAAAAAHGMAACYSETHAQPGGRGVGSGGGVGPSPQPEGDGEVYVSLGNSKAACFLQCGSGGSDSGGLDAALDVAAWLRQLAAS